MPLQYIIHVLRQQQAFSPWDCTRDGLKKTAAHGFKQKHYRQQQLWKADPVMKIRDIWSQRQLRRITVVGNKEVITLWKYTSAHQGECERTGLYSPHEKQQPSRLLKRRNQHEEDGRKQRKQEQQNKTGKKKPLNISAAEFYFWGKK